MASWLVEYQKELWALGTVVFAAVVSRLLRLRAILAYNVGHASDLLLDVPDNTDVSAQGTQRQVIHTALISPRSNATSTFGAMPSCWRQKRAFNRRKMLRLKASVKMAGVTGHRAPHARSPKRWV